MGGSNHGQYAAGVSQRQLRWWRGGLQFAPHVALPSVGVGLGIIDRAAPEAILIVEFLPVVFRVKGFVGVGISATGPAAAHAALERERLEEFDAQAAGEAEGASVAGGHGGIAP